MDVFEAVKQAVTTRQAAEHYGIHVGRNGMACCPFHKDKTPSLKADRRFHCFGCQADGDVIDFAARLFDLSGVEAAKRLLRILESPRQPGQTFAKACKTEHTGGASLLAGGAEMLPGA